MDEREIQELVRERDEALLSLDLQKLLSYCRKYHVHIPDNIEAFWGGVHKARLICESIPEPEKQQSREWLTAHGFTLEPY